jgi:hypothetical protein
MMLRMLPTQSAALLLALAAGAAVAAEPPSSKKGVIWESTTAMEASGMSMPPQTMRTCAPEGDWKEPPSTQRPDSTCRVTDLKQSGKTTTWKMACDEPEKMTGAGSMTRDGDTYRGTMDVTSKQGSMQMKLSGRKIGGACELGKPVPGDARQAEMMAMMEQSKQGMAKEMEKECTKAAREMQAALFLMQGAYTCQGTPQQAEFCKRLKTDEGFRKAGQVGEENLEKAAKLCKVDLAAVRSRACAAAAKARDLAYLGASCPAERKALAQKECAGKEDSNLAPDLRDFCLRHGKELLIQDPKAKAKKKSAEAEPEPEPKEGAVDQGKKALKGILGF